ncbi:MAG: bifunctional UDP-N-acetylglucosamine diphosphorylase/glucosamine-1-phosphate N-acetyltransferase GlmU [Oscillospiraceae bacterium]|nr:bifunctional UDP-N-acetylglucosamine diphosphorylase/glucosamine-1-phosphate N-acetyltransferase GlmU [Oscillospiraceae bacterium]
MDIKKSCAVILAAGDGKRMRSRYPKAMCQVLFKPMISWVTDWCRAAGIEDICVVTGNGGEFIKKVLPDGVQTTEQAERKGTGHAVMMAKEFLRKHSGANVIVLCADAPFVDSDVIGQSFKDHSESGAAVTVITAQLDDPKGYGRIVRGENGLLQGIVEHRDATEEQLKINEINSGSYWFNADFLLSALDELTCENAQGEYYLTDTVKIAVSKGEKAAACLWEDSSISLGANDRAGLLKLNRIAGQKVLDRLMGEGVNFYCTDGVVISPDAVIGADTTIGPNTVIKGKTTIGSGCVIEGGCIIENSTIGDDCEIYSSMLEQSFVGNGVRIGPNAHLRPKTVLKDGVKVGNFVEVKNSVVGEKTSLAHLTYIGDTDIGCHVNVGCGTAVANYDGVNKYRTEIEDFAFIGCSTVLVSPVKVGKGAYTGAGSVITQDIPQDALAVARAKQSNIDGWAERWRKKNNWQEYFEKKNPKK